MIIQADGPEALLAQCLYTSCRQGGVLAAVSFGDEKRLPFQGTRTGAEILLDRFPCGVRQRHEIIGAVPPLPPDAKDALSVTEGDILYLQARHLYGSESGPEHEIDDGEVSQDRRPHPGEPSALLLPRCEVRQHPVALLRGEVLLNELILVLRRLDPACDVRADAPGLKEGVQLPYR